MRTKNILLAFVGAVSLLSGCDVKDPIYDTPHPQHGKITLTTDWTGRTEGINVPAGYTVQIGDYSATLSGATNTIDNLFTPGTYHVYIYNTADNISVSGTTATADYAAGNPGPFFSCAMDAAIEKDKEHTFTAVMKQQVRRLTLVIEPEGDAVDRIVGITASLSGVAGTLDIKDDTHGSATSVPLAFTKIAAGTDAGKWTATAWLLGITGGEKKLTGTISFTDGNPADMPLESDLTAELASFNADKKTPLALGSTLVETPAGTGFTATIDKWETIDRNEIVAD